MRIFIKTILTTIAIFIYFISLAQDEYDIPDPPDNLPAIQKTEFLKWKDDLTFWLSDLQELNRQFNSTCAGKEKTDNQCKILEERIERHDASLRKKIREYQRELDTAEENVKNVLHIKKTMIELTRKLNWSKDKIDRFEIAFDKLGEYRVILTTPEIVDGTWSRIIERGEDPNLQLEANKGKGPGLPNAGKQTNNDCAVFALANATGLPYSVVAARAMKLITEGEWRKEEYKKDPQKIFRDGGLIGSEVLMLTEAFGQVEVIRSDGFEKTLKSGRTIMINVFPPSGTLNSGHEVVLTKTFTHKGETWFEMIDSNMEGPWQRRYLSLNDLQTILKEDGVVYRPETGTVPKLLRSN